MGKTTIGNGSWLSASGTGVKDASIDYGTLNQWLSGHITAQLIDTGGINVHTIRMRTSPTANYNIYITATQINVSGQGDIYANGSPGRSGLIKFSDGSSIGINKGIITSVTAPTGADAAWSPTDGRG